ncbi:MAG TPA: MOSC N-terminal beta barrel domain-containing protein [Polyangiaceae bacterium]|nr:MOSC N-terminal beta barrel domain-containing protein [Polyangiaceae bacterium]
MSRIEIFPIKSLDAVRVDASSVTPGGILENDRVYAIVDLEGRVVNGKRTDRIHLLRSSFDADIEEVSLWQSGESSPRRFALRERAPLNRWLSDFFGFPITVEHEPVKGFPDDTLAFGPTVVGDASLRRVCDWYEGWTLEATRRRFRTNLELEGGEAFCEDQLFGAPGSFKPFRIGAVQFMGHNPCQRCLVPARDPETGAPLRGFQKTFAELRKEHLPTWTDARRFNHFYRFAVNTSIPPSEGGKRLQVGDALAL